MKKYASYGAYLGLLLCVVGLLNYSAGHVWNLLSWLTVIPGVILLLAFIILRFDLIKSMLTLRRVNFQP